MKILFLVHRVPYPPNRGDRIRSFHILEYLASRADVHLAFPSEGPIEPETLDVLRRSCAEVAAVPVGQRGRWFRGAWSLATRHTATEGLFRSPGLRRAIAGMARRTKFDLVMVFCSSMVQYLRVPELKDIPSVVDLVDVDSQKWFDYANKCRGVRAWLFRLEGQRLRRLEGTLPETSRAVTLVSQHEADLFCSFCPSDRVHAVSNGVDLDYFQPMGSGDDTAMSCVFVGALDYRANIDGIDWFVREVWPEVHRRKQQARFVMVGARPTAAIERLSTCPGVVLAGEVSDVRPYLADAAMAVVPLRVARGLQNKVLEAMASGKAVVASAEALEGLEVEPGVHVRQAGTTPEEWIETIVALLDDPKARQRLGQAGRLRVEQRYTWQRRLEPLGDLLGIPPTRGTRQQAKRDAFGSVDRGT